MQDPQSIYNKLSKKEKKEINRKIDLMMDMNTSVEQSKEIEDQLFETLFSIETRKGSNVLYIESDEKESYFKRIIELAGKYGRWLQKKIIKCMV
ncbi:hypothetical protein [Aquimarina sp. RZ0]|uniref:hypothetical protein n=1 Tax=Aquimarina sp. RZ0 TaxID=2607730 RepID=UPI0011F2E20A|nr:hypothetical protein [Aquimarina sp. RZ0]KAA1244503.1 hypothetical protein F0000_16075 [Aquimarina sp. RZ0]